MIHLHIKNCYKNYFLCMNFVKTIPANMKISNAIIAMRINLLYSTFLDINLRSLLLCLNP